MDEPAAATVVGAGARDGVLVGAVGTGASLMGVSAIVVVEMGKVGERGRRWWTR